MQFARRGYFFSDETGLSLVISACAYFTEKVRAPIYIARVHDGPRRDFAIEKYVIARDPSSSEISDSVHTRAHARGDKQ